MLTLFPLLMQLKWPSYLREAGLVASPGGPDEKALDQDLASSAFERVTSARHLLTPRGREARRCRRARTGGLE